MSTVLLDSFILLLTTMFHVCCVLNCMFSIEFAVEVSIVEFLHVGAVA